MTGVRQVLAIFVWSLVVTAVPAAAALPLGNGEGRIAYSRCTERGVSYACSAQIYVMNADGASPRRITRATSVDDRDPDWSPDGRRIAFWRERYSAPDAAPGSRPRPMVFVINADGTGERRLVRGSLPSWSPDGTTIAFQRNGVVLIGVDGKGLRRLTRRGGLPSWSPDGKTIAFVNNNGRRNEIRLMNADGSNQRVLSLPPRVSPMQPVWHPTGQTVTYQTSRGPFVIDAGGGTPLPFLPQVGLDLDDLTWSPDGRTIAVISWPEDSEGHEIYRLKADGSGVRRLTRTKVEEYGPDWSGTS